jgi:transcriptional regulator with XRE-family HTH domain
MTINPTLKIIRTKKLGVLVRDARTKTGKDLSVCAQAIGLTPEEFQSIEYGDRPPTLPELEILSYFLEIPLDHFWGSETLKTNGKSKLIDPEQIKKLRQRVIGAMIRKARIDAELSIDDLAEKSGCNTVTLLAYELGETAIPLPELEILAQALDKTIDDFQDQHGPVGTWFVQQRAMREFQDLSPELQSFVCKPVNRPYLELAVRLSEMQVEKLRAVAEGLLEITL